MKRLLPLIVTSALLGGCAHGARGPLTLGPADSGKTVQLAVGQEVTVRLAWDPGTGYRWQTTSDPDALVLIVIDSGYDRPPARTPGSPGQAWWRLRATGAGSTSFALRYVRPWELDEKAQDFTLTVAVK